MQNYVDADRAANEDRVIELASNNKAHIRKSGPFGFWAVSFERGRPPDSLSGLYTSPAEAERALNIYLTVKGRLPPDKE